jgi:NADPH-ferrihemoprotein reductase
MLPRVGIRYYSISSSSKESPNSISLTAVVVRYALSSPLINKDSHNKEVAVIKQGLATSWLERLHESRISSPLDSSPISIKSNHTVPKLFIPIYIRTSSFKLPKSPSTPIIMIGPGTGLAPFRGFVRERFYEASQGTNVGPTWLFYGCRNSEEVFFLI